MANMSFSNNAATTLASGITNVASTLTVATSTGALFPVITGSQYFYCTLANNAGTTEVIKVTARTGTSDTFTTIVRGQDNTSAVAWNTGDKCELRLVAASLNDFPKLDEVNTFTQTQTIATLNLTNPLGTQYGGEGIQPISASVAANAMTISVPNALSLDFRSATLGSGTVTRVAGTPANLVIPSTATLGTVSAVASRLVVLVLNNAGTLELAVVNISGSTDLSETVVVSTIPIAAASNSATIVYSTTGRTALAYRVLGYIDSTQTTAGTWATAPSTIQGAGGNAVTAMSSFGFGQVWTNVLVSRAWNTVYTNTTSKAIAVLAAGTSGSNLLGYGLTTIQVNSLEIYRKQLYHATDTQTDTPGMFVVQPGQTYQITMAGTFASPTIWYELR